MGCGGQTSSSTSTTTPPAWAEDAYQNLSQQAANIASKPLQLYNAGPNADNLVAGFNPTQEQAFQQTENLQGVANPYISQASTDIQNSTKPLWSSVQQFSPSAVSTYESPYTSQVVQATEAQIQNQNAQQDQQLDSNAIAKGAWGGDRAGIAQSSLANQQDLASNQTIAGLENQGYSQALGEFNQQQQAQLGANQANAWLNSQAGYGEGNLGNEALSTGLEGTNALLGTGGEQQGLTQEQLNVPYEQYLQEQAYPFQTTSWLAGIDTGVGSLAGGTTTSQGETNSGSWLGSLLGGAGAAIGGLGEAGAFTGNGILSAASLGLKKGGRPTEGYRLLLKRADGGTVDLGSLEIVPPKGLAAGGSAGYDGGGGVGGSVYGLPNVPNVDVSPVTGQAANGIPGVNITHGNGPPNPTNPYAGMDQNQGLTAGDLSGIKSGLGVIGSNNSTETMGGPQTIMPMNTPIGTGLDPDLASSLISSGENMDLTIAGDKRGGRIHYDAGGSLTVPGLLTSGVGSAVSQDPRLQNLYRQASGMTTEQLQEKIAQYGGAGSPQGQAMQTILQARRMMPAQQPQQGLTAGQAPQPGQAPKAPVGLASGQQGLAAQPQKRGGIAHYAESGTVAPDGDDTGYDNSSVAMPAADVAEDNHPGIPPMSDITAMPLGAPQGFAASSDVPVPQEKPDPPQGLAPATGLAAVTPGDATSWANRSQITAHPGLSSTAAPLPSSVPAGPDPESLGGDKKPLVDHSGDTVQVHFPSEGKTLDTGLPVQKPDPWMALIAGSAALMAGRGNLGQNLGQGILAGLSNYAGQKKGINDEAAQAAKEQQEQADTDLRRQQLKQTSDYQNFEMRKPDATGLTYRVFNPKTSTWDDTGIPTTEALTLQEQQQIHKDQLANQGAELGIRQQELEIQKQNALREANKGDWEPVRSLTNSDGTPVTDKDGVPQAIYMDRFTGTTKQMPLPDQAIAGGKGRGVGGGATGALIQMLMADKSPDAPKTPTEALALIHDPSGKGAALVQMGILRLAQASAAADLEGGGSTTENLNKYSDYWANRFAMEQQAGVGNQRASAAPAATPPASSGTAFMPGGNNGFRITEKTVTVPRDPSAATPPVPMKLPPVSQRTIGMTTLDAKGNSMVWGGNGWLTPDVFNQWQRSNAQATGAP